MKAVCIKEYRYDGNVKKMYDTEIGKVYKTESNGVTETVYDEYGYYVIAVDHERFFEYFEIIDEAENVNHPDHYNQGEMETIDVIEYVLSDINGKYAFALGNIIKYVVRANMKGGKEDLDKAKWYIEHLIGGLNE